MKAMILAAGRGERMRPLTDNIPKPLLQAGNKSLIEHQLDKLKQAGITGVVINLAYRGEQIRTALGNGANAGMNIVYSDEGASALETAGGIIQALPLLGTEPFIVINSDIWIDYPLMRLPVAQDTLAHLVLVANPEHNPQGDFALVNGKLNLQQTPKLTYSGLGVYSPQLFHGFAPGKRRLLDVLKPAIDAGNISGEYFPGTWLDIGTPERLNFLQQHLSST